MGSPKVPTISGQANIYQPAYQSQADTQLQGYFSGFNNPYSTISGQAAQAAQNQYNNPYAGQYGQAANYAGATAGNAANYNTAASQWLQGGAEQGLSSLNNLENMANDNVYIGGALTGSEGGGSILQNSSLNALQSAGSLNPAAMSNYGYAQNAAGTLGAGAGQILNTAFDPQGQLYNQQYQQNQDQTQASLAQMGLGTSGAGAGILNQSQQNFNTNWQNQQLGRQAAGLSSAEGAYGQGQSGLNSGLSGLQNAATTAQGIGAAAGTNYAAGAALPNTTFTDYLSSLAGLQGQTSTAENAYGNLYNTGSGLNTTAITDTLNMGALPYQTQQTIGGNQQSALQQYLQTAASGQNMSQQQIGDLMQYLGLGTSAGEGLAGAQNTAYQTQANQYGQELQGLGSLLGGSASGGGFLGGLSSLGSLFGL